MTYQGLSDQILPQSLGPNNKIALKLVKKSGVTYAHTKPEKLRDCPKDQDEEVIKVNFGEEGK